MRLLFGKIHKKLFYYEFHEVSSTDKIRISKKIVSNSYKNTTCIKCPSVAWVLIPPTKNKIEVFEDISYLDSKKFADILPSIILQLRSYQENKIMNEVFIEMLKNLLQDKRLQTPDILDITSIPSVKRIIVYLGFCLSTQIRREIAKSYQLESLWLKIDNALPEDVFQLTKFLLSDSEALYWKNKREEILLKISEKKKAREIELEAHKMYLKVQEENLRKIIGDRGILQLPDDIEITDEYLEVIKKIKSNEKVIFITGEPGTGKSTLIQLLKTIFHDNTAVLSFTGVAALNIGGQTINSFFQMPFHILPLNWINDTRSFKAKAQAIHRIIIDEVSMLRPDMLDAISSALINARKDNRPFGGVQSIFFGDLYQLPPVLSDDKAVQEYYKKTYQGNRFFFASKAIQQSTLDVITLKKMFRTNQPNYLSFLSKIRSNTASGEDLDYFNMIVQSAPEFTDSESFIEVTPYRASADRKNQMKLEILEGNVKKFKVTIEGESLLKMSREQLKNLFPGDLILYLKPKAQVMFVKNDEGKRWVNGDIGIIEDINEDSLKITTRTGTYIVHRVCWNVSKYELDSMSHQLVEEEIGQIHQFPIRLAWAITIHKIQGQTFDKLLIDFTGGVFESGMAYVALSRCRTIEGLRFTRNIVPADIIVDNDVVDFMNSLLHKDTTHNGRKMDAL